MQGSKAATAYDWPPSRRGDVLVELMPGVGVNVAPTGCTTEESDTPCLLFTADNWRDAQTVTLSSESDDLGRVNHDGVSSDAGYDGRGAILTVNGDENLPDTDRAIFLPLIRGSPLRP